MKLRLTIVFASIHIFLLAQNNTPKNVILMIGDGMGLSQVSMAYYFQKDNTNFSRFNDIGLIITSSASHKITDSAAGATAFAAGEKTYNGAICLDTDSNHLTSIVDILYKEKKMSSGLVATSSITHATPACFYAHQLNRKMEKEIAKDMLKANISYFAGGGKKFFRPIFEQLSKKYIIDTSQLIINDMNQNKNYAFLLAENGMPKMTEGRGDFLPKATKLGLERLSMDTDGFFFMIEGSQIDWGGHANDADYILNELLDFDKSIGLVLDFAEKNGETLVIVTADHETGGLALTAQESRLMKFLKGKRDYNIIKPSFTSGGHSTSLVPVFAYGPGSENFRGVYNNTEIFKNILKSVIKKAQPQ